MSDVASIPSEKRSRCDCCLRCLARVPYASFIAFILSAAGVVIFCVCTHKAVEITNDMLKNVFDYSYDCQSTYYNGGGGGNGDARSCFDYENVAKVFIGVGAGMGGVALILLLLGFISTGVTRDQVFSGYRSRMGGRVSMIVFMTLSYLLNLAWLAIMSAMAIVSFVSYVFLQHCDRAALITEDSQCLNLTQFELFDQSPIRGDKLQICGQKYNDFCTATKNATAFYFAAFCGAVVIVLGLVHFLVALGSNYAHIKDSQKLRDYDMAYYDEQEMQAMTK